MEYQSPFLLIKALQTRLNGALSAIDLLDLPPAEQKVLSGLKNELVDARLDVRDYELSETRDEQLHKAKDACERLELIRGAILAASEYNVFSAIDVAQFTAQLEQVIDTIR